MADLNAGVTTACSDLGADLVKEIVDTDLTDARINNFINFAYFITKPLADELDDCGGSDALCAIMQMLAAHFLTMYERSTVSENIAGEWSVRYAIKEGLGLESSLYGQNAIALDCSGILASAGLKRAWIEVISYEQIEGDLSRYLDEDLT